MRSATPDPEFVEGLRPQTYPEIRSFHDDTARAGALEHRPGVKAALDEARARTLTASGFSETLVTASAIANKKGNFGFHVGSTAPLLDDDAHGGRHGLRVGRLRVAALRGREGRGPRRAGREEGAGERRAEGAASRRVHGHPRAARRRGPPRDLLLLAHAAHRRRGAELPVEAGRRQPHRRGGLRAESSRCARTRSTRASPGAPGREAAGRAAAAAAFLGFGGFGGSGAAGLPARKTTWVEKGVVKAVPVDRYWAAKNRLEAAAVLRQRRPRGRLGHRSTTSSPGTERGLLVTHFFYIRSVNPQTVQLTGLTRDGLWLVEKGKVVGPVQNFRFNDSPVNVLKNVEAMSASEPAGNDGRAGDPGARLQVHVQERRGLGRTARERSAWRTRSRRSSPSRFPCASSRPGRRKGRVPPRS